MSSPSVTRGYGLLERWLARKRAQMADRLIPQALRSGSVLDFGCGTFPYFLSRTRFAERVGVDRNAGQAAPPTGGQAEGCGPIALHDFDMDQEQRLPFPDGRFDVVTMLAVFEHIRRDRLLLLLDELDRVLKPGGCLILTTPAAWTGPLLWCLKTLRLVSAVEIEEHQDSYSHKTIRAVLDRTALGPHPARMAYFECFMNIWVVLSKPAGD